MNESETYELEILNAYERGELRSLATREEIARVRAAATVMPGRWYLLAIRDIPRRYAAVERGKVNSEAP